MVNWSVWHGNQFRSSSLFRLFTSGQTTKSDFMLEKEYLPWKTRLSAHEKTRTFHPPQPSVCGFKVIWPLSEDNEVVTCKPRPLLLPDVKTDIYILLSVLETVCAALYSLCQTLRKQAETVWYRYRLNKSLSCFRAGVHTFFALCHSLEAPILYLFGKNFGKKHCYTHQTKLLEQAKRQKQPK